MSDIPAFSAADLESARERGRSEAATAFQAEQATALAAARADADARIKGISEAATALDPTNARMGAFFAAVAAGTDVAAATKIAGFVPVATAEAPGRRDDVARVLAGQAPGISAENAPAGNVPAPADDARASRLREIGSIKVKL